MCMIDSGDGYVTVLSESLPTARKAHGCGECGRVIAVGETYLQETYVFEGEIRKHRTCAHCRRVRAWLVSECGGFLHGAIDEDIEEHAYGGDYGVRVKMMAAGIRRQWRRRDGKPWPLPSIGSPANATVEG